MVEIQTQTPIELEGHVVIRPRSRSRSRPRAQTKTPPRHSPSPPPPQRPPRHKFSSLRRDLDPYPAAFASQHYKPRHFSGHGYGAGKFPSVLASSSSMNPRDASKAPLASLEDITPSLRSSFASVMMYPPSDWGNSNDSFDSTIMINLSNQNEDQDGNENDEDINKEFAVPDSEFDTKFDDFRISPGRNLRKCSLSSLSVQSALT